MANNLRQISISITRKSFREISPSHWGKIVRQVESDFPKTENVLKPYKIGLV
jgi:hypothetical protein